MNQPYLLRRAACAALTALLCACAGKKPVKDLKTARAGSQAAAPAGLSAPEAEARGFQFHATPELRAIAFAVDASRLEEAARETLKRNADAIKKNDAWIVLVEGHCDQRGTTEYNLALGQRRAKAVREYYILLGVPGDRLATRSYGEEAPVCGESTEDCWAKNRRAESKVRTAVAETERDRGS